MLIPLTISFIIFMIAVFAETNRLPFEAIPVAVDMLGHRLVSLKALDAKTARANLNLDRQ